MGFFKKLFKKDELSVAKKEFTKILELQEKLFEAQEKFGENEEIQTNREILYTNAGMIGTILNKSPLSPSINTSNPSAKIQSVSDDKKEVAFETIDVYVDGDLRISMTKLTDNFSSVVDNTNLKPRAKEIIIANIHRKLSTIIVKYASKSKNKEAILAFCIRDGISILNMKNRFSFVMTIDFRKTNFTKIKFKDETALYLNAAIINSDGFYTKEEVMEYLESMDYKESDYIIVTN